MKKPKIITVDQIVAAGEKVVSLPLQSAALGEAVSVRVRRISSSEQLALLPSDPPGSEDWPKGEEWRQRARAWFEALPDAEKEARRQQIRELDLHVAVLACLEPKITLDQARMMGDDAAVISGEVLRFSGLLTEPKKDATKSDEKKQTAAKPGGDAS